MRVVARMRSPAWGKGERIEGAAKKIFELGKEFGPAILSTAGYSFFKGFM